MRLGKQTRGLTILDAMRDPALFRPLFQSESWRPWIVALSAIFGIAEPDRAGFKLYQECTKRTRWVKEAAREVWLVIGRRGGKSRIAALITVFLACFCNYIPFLAPGEVATILVIASDRLQARVVFGYIRALLSSVPMLAKMVISEKSESIELSNRVRIEVATCSFRATRGYTIAAVVCDEIAYWRSEDSANPDTEVLNAIKPGMATIPGSLLLAISSPYARRGAMYAAHSKHFGKDGDVLVWQAPTRTMNETVPQSIIDDALSADPESARAEYFAEFRSDLETFVNADALRACVEVGCFERAPIPGVRYFGFVDPSGGSADSMTLGISHIERERTILDVIREVTPPFSPESVTAEFAGVLKSYRISIAEGDRYGAEWVREQFGKHGIELRASGENRSELYLRVLPAINSGKIDLLDHPRMLRQFEQLERRTGRGTGKDSVDHPPGFHDDAANAGAGAVCLALRELGGGAGWAAQAARRWVELGRPAITSETALDPERAVRDALGLPADLPMTPGDIARAAAREQAENARLPHGGTFGKDKTPYSGQHPSFCPTRSAGSSHSCPKCQFPQMAVYGSVLKCSACGHIELGDSGVRVSTVFGNWTDPDR